MLASAGVIPTSLLALVLLLCAAAVDQGTLRDLAKTQGRLVLDIHREFPGVALKELVGASDAVLRGTIVEASGYLSADEREIHTRYVVRVSEVAFARVGKTLAEGDTIQVTTPGGVLQLERARIEANEKDFPPFKVGDECVLFLKSTAEPDFVLPHGGQSAFRVHNGIARQMSAVFGTWNRARGSVPAAVLLNEVRQMKQQ
jgi:hypothetical protein